MAKSKGRNQQKTNAPLGYEAQLWQMADSLRGSMDAAEQYGVPPADNTNLAWLLQLCRIESHIDLRREI